MTPTQISDIEAAVTAIRDIDDRFGPALDAQQAANEAVTALSAESEQARQAYETLFWTLKDDPDLLNTAQSAPDVPEVDMSDASVTVTPVEPEPVVEPVVDVAPEPVAVQEPAVEGADAPVEDTNPADTV